jgi:hypothetical protein
MTRSHLMLALTTVALSACATEPPAQLPAGQWSASTANLFVSASGTTLELVCRQASLPGTLSLDDGGRFQVDATVASYGITVTYYEATITGRLDGDALRLSITARAPGTSPELYTLQRRPAPNLDRCG